MFFCEKRQCWGGYPPNSRQFWEASVHFCPWKVLFFGTFSRFPVQRRIQIVYRARFDLKFLLKRLEILGKLSQEKGDGGTPPHVPFPYTQNNTRPLRIWPPLFNQFWINLWINLKNLLNRFSKFWYLGKAETLLFQKSIRFAWFWNSETRYIATYRKLQEKGIYFAF